MLQKQFTGTKFSLAQSITAFFRLYFIKLKSHGNFSVGKNVYIGRNHSIRSIYNLEIGNNVYVGKNVTIECELKTGNDILIANNVGIIGRRDHHIKESLPFFQSSHVTQLRSLSLKTTIGNNVWIGFGSIVLSGISIGSNVVVSAGSVVRDDIPDNCIVAGNPARVVQQLQNRH